MRFVVRVLRMSLARARMLRPIERAHWCLSRLILLCGWTLVVIGLLLAPTPIPIGLPMIVLGAIIILNISPTAKKAFVRAGRRYPRTVGRVRNMLRARRRASYRRTLRQAEAA